jgi:hypothetical protein
VAVSIAHPMLVLQQVEQFPSAARDSPLVRRSAQRERDVRGIGGSGMTKQAAQ